MILLERRPMCRHNFRPFRALVVLLLLGSVWALNSAPVDLPQLIEAIRADMQPSQAMGFMQRVYSTDRWFTYPKFEETAVFLKTAMEDIGLKNVEMLSAPADGVTQAGFWTMGLAWD